MTDNYWNVELHSHTYWSLDCLVSFEQIIRLCEQRGVDKIAITDHNTAAGALKFKQIAPELVIVGEEIFTTQGELLAYFVKQTVPAGLTPQETIKRLREQGAVISVSHPFDLNRKGRWQQADLDKIIDQVDAIETFNARCLTAGENDRALTYANEHQIAGTVGSDAHTPGEYGRATLRMPTFTTADEFRAGLLTATAQTQKSPLHVHLGSTFAKWSRKLGLNQQPQAD